MPSWPSLIHFSQPARWTFEVSPRILAGILQPTPLNTLMDFWTLSYIFQFTYNLSLPRHCGFILGYGCCCCCCWFFINRLYFFYKSFRALVYKKLSLYYWELPSNTPPLPTQFLLSLTSCNAVVNLLKLMNQCWYTLTKQVHDLH